MRKIDYAAQTMATSYELARPLDAYAKRLKRIQASASEEVYQRLGKRQATTGPVYAAREWKDSMSARGMRDGIEEFKNAYPEHADELEEMIRYQRQVRRNYLSFEFDGLPDSFYRKIMEDVGIPSVSVDEALHAIKEMSYHLEELKQPVKILME
jgi:hypothetical protein